MPDIPDANSPSGDITPQPSSSALSIINAADVRYRLVRTAKYIWLSEGLPSDRIKSPNELITLEDFCNHLSIDLPKETIKWAKKEIHTVYGWLKAYRAVNARVEGSIGDVVADVNPLFESINKAKLEISPPTKDDEWAELRRLAALPENTFHFATARKNALAALSEPTNG